MRTHTGVSLCITISLMYYAYSEWINQIKRFSLVDNVLKWKIVNVKYKDHMMAISGNNYVWSFPEITSESTSLRSQAAFVCDIFPVHWQRIPWANATNKINNFAEDAVPIPEVVECLLTAASVRYTVAGSWAPCCKQKLSFVLNIQHPPLTLAETTIECISQNVKLFLSWSWCQNHLKIWLFSDAVML